MEVGLTLLAHASMPLKFWDEAFLTAVFLINRLPSRVINNETPFYRLFGKEPEYTSLRTFGCACWPHLRPYNTKKLAFHSKQCVFLGYSNQHKGFKCLDPKEGRVYISRDVTFDEHVFPFASLHPNAGARLRAEIALLPDVLINPTSTGDAQMSDLGLFSPLSSNGSNVFARDQSVAGQNFGAMPHSCSSQSSSGGRHFMCPPSGIAARPEWISLTRHLILVAHLL